MRSQNNPHRARGLDNAAGNAPLLFWPPTPRDRCKRQSATLHGPGDSRWDLIWARNEDCLRGPTARTRSEVDRRKIRVAVAARVPPSMYVSMRCVLANPRERASLNVLRQKRDDSHAELQLNASLRLLAVLIRTLLHNLHTGPALRLRPPVDGQCAQLSDTRVLRAALRIDGLAGPWRRGINGVAGRLEHGGSWLQQECAFAFPTRLSTRAFRFAPGCLAATNSYPRRHMLDCGLLLMILEFPSVVTATNICSSIDPSTVQRSQ